MRESAEVGSDLHQQRSQTPLALPLVAVASGVLTEYFGNKCGIAAHLDARVPAEASAHECWPPPPFSLPTDSMWCVIGKTPAVLSVNPILCRQLRSSEQTGR